MTRKAKGAASRPRPHGFTAADFAAWRTGAGLTQGGAAAALGIGLISVRRIEQGDPDAPISRTVALAVRAVQAGLTP